MEPDKEVAEIELGQIFTVVMIISITVVGTAYMLNVLSDTKDDFCTDSYDDGECRTCATGFTYNGSANDCYNATNTSDTAAYTLSQNDAFNATNGGVTAVAKFPTKMTLVATIVVAVIIITLLTRYFKF